MKTQLIHKNLLLAIFMSSLILLFGSCLKKSDADIQPLGTIPFKGQNLSKTLASQSSLTLFYQAFNRLSLAGSFSDNGGYTIFAPTDSAMKAAGLDSDGINKLNIDSLRKLITYQIVVGILDEKTLTNSIGTAQITTFRQDPITTVNGSTSLQTKLIFVSENSSLYFNGISVNKSGPAVQASNGYIFPVSSFISDLPYRTLYDIIKSDPDLTLYNQALMIADSVRDVGLFGSDGSEDILFYSTVQPKATNGMLPTILAPTNKAFNDAGFHTVDDIRQYANRSYVGYDLNTFLTFYYSPLDSVLEHHVLYNQAVANANVGNSVRIFYNNLLNTSINNGTYNTYEGSGRGSLIGSADNYLLKFTVPLTFSTSNGSVYVNYNKTDPSVKPVILPRDASAMHPINNFIASNGALYKIDKLFYPAVKK